MRALHVFEEEQGPTAENEVAIECDEEARKVGQTDNETEQTSCSEDMASLSAAASSLLDLYVL